MVRLMLPELLMAEAEWLAFEILTLIIVCFEMSCLAARSVAMTMATLVSLH